MFCWTSDVCPALGVQRGAHGHVARVGVTRRAHDPTAQGGQSNGFTRPRNQITVWTDSDRWAAECNLQR
jgi:hypothetical protein